MFWVETLAHCVVSKLSVIDVFIGNPFSNSFRESGITSSEIFPKLKYKSPPECKELGFVFSASSLNGSRTQN
jgi:hypothetical protein